jgi:hypothetical protein
MTTLTMNNTTTITCAKAHTPHMESVSTVSDFLSMVEYTFCEVCEQNIDRFYIDDDYDRLPFWTKWSVTK